MLEVVLEKMPEGGFWFAFAGVLLLIGGVVGAFALSYLRGEQDDAEGEENEKGKAG